MMIGFLKTSLVKLSLPIMFAATLTACGDRDTRDEVFYFVLPDRFTNGDVSNDTGGLEGDRSVHGLDPSSEDFFHGGDLAGLMEKLPYIEEMGVTSIWITPIFKNEPVSMSGDSGAYHGYWINDFYQVDPHLGTNKELKKFIKEAHKRDMKVFFDIVTNHTADIIRYEECHNPDGSFPEGQNGCPYIDKSQPAYTPFIPEGKETAKNPEWLNDPSFYHNRGDSPFDGGEAQLHGDFYGLDDLATQNPVVIDGMIDIFEFWISEFQIDGFRLDTVKDVHIEFWQEFAPAMREHAASEGIDDFFIFGEVFDSRQSLLSAYTREGELDSVLDFDLNLAMTEVIANGGSPQRLSKVFAADDFFIQADSDATTLMTFASNHDIGRFGYHLRDPDPDVRLAKLELAHSLMYFGRGIPIIYYGDEQGFTGGIGDKANREDMMPGMVESHWGRDLIGTDATVADDNFDPTHPMYLTLREYKDVLDAHPTLRRGKQHVRHADDSAGIFAFSRVYELDPRDYIVVLNTDSVEHSVTLDAAADSYTSVYPLAGDSVAVVGGQVTITVPAYSTVIVEGDTFIQGPSLDSLTLGVSSGQKFKGRFELPVNLTWMEETPLPMTQVKFYMSVEGGPFEHIGTDYNMPFSMYPGTSDMIDGTQFTVRAVAEDQWGNELQSEDVQLEVGEDSGMEIFFQKPDNWAKRVNVFWWDMLNQADGNWPGIPMEPMADGWFRVQLPDGHHQGNLIFNDVSGQLTGSLYRKGSGCYVASTNTWTDECDPPELGITLTFEKPDYWGDEVNAYYWNAAPAPGVDWPGVTMKHLVDNWYRVTLPNDVQAANVIFNDGQGNQTSDLYREGDGCYTNGIWVDTCDFVLPGMRMRFVKPDFWGDNVNIYYWNAGTQADINWPGVPMTDVGDGVYEFQFDDDVLSANIVFNDGSNQSSDVFSEEDQCYRNFVLEAYDNCEPGAFAPGFRVNFFLPAGWGSDINIHYWDASPLGNTNWPGEPMDNLGGGWYTYVFPEGVSAANIIFNDGLGNQTANLSRSSDGCYVDSNWVDSCDAPLPGMYIQFVKPDSWGDNINIYYWNTVGADYSVGWPGEAMLDTGSGIYEFQFPDNVEASNLIFNDGQGNQTSDLFRASDGCYIDGDWVAGC